MKPVPEEFPMSRPLAATEEIPVPPRVLASVPVHPGVKVWVLPVEVTVRVMFVSVDVANVCVFEVSPLRSVSPVPPLPQSTPVPEIGFAFHERAHP